MTEDWVFWLVVGLILATSFVLAGFIVRLQRQNRQLMEDLRHDSQLHHPSA